MTTEFFEGLHLAFEPARMAMEAMQKVIATGVETNVETTLMFVSASREGLEKALGITRTLAENIRGGKCKIPPNNARDCEEAVIEYVVGKRVAGDIKRYGLVTLLEHSEEMLQFMLVCNANVEDLLKRSETFGPKVASDFATAWSQFERCFLISRELGKLTPGSQQKAA